MHDKPVAALEDAKAVVNYREAAELLGVPVGTLHSWVHRKAIPHLRFGRRLVRFEVDALRMWVASRRVETNAGPEIVAKQSRSMVRSPCARA